MDKDIVNIDETFAIWHYFCFLIFFNFLIVLYFQVFISTLKDTWSEKVQESTSNKKISLASNILCPFQAQQSALRAPSIPTEAPYTPSSSLFLASSSSYRPSKIHGPPRKFKNQPQTRKSASPRIYYARFKPNKVHCVLPRYPSRHPVYHLLHFFLRLRLHIDPQRYMVRRESS